MKTLTMIATAAAALTISTSASAGEMAPAALNITNIGTATLAFAGDPPAHARGNGRRGRDNRRDRGNRGRYNDRGQYIDPQRLGRDDRIWRGRDGNYYCERGNGTTGLVIGAGLGALAGRAIDTRGDRTVGTVLGAIAGGVLGREIDRGELRCR